MEQIGELHDLRELHLIYERLTGAPSDLSAFSRLPNLASLQIGNASINGEGLKHLSEARSLRILTINGGEITDSLKPLSNLQHLRYLYFANAVIANQAMESLALLPAIRLLRLDGPSLSDAAIDHLPALTEVRWVGIDGAVSDAGREKLSKAVMKSNLNPEYTSRVRETASWILEHGGSVGISPAAGQPLRNAADLPATPFTIVSVSLSNDPAFDDIGLQRICEFADMESLTASSAAITDTGLSQLKSQSRLESLLLGGTKITDDGLAALADCTNLSILYLRDTAVTGRGLASVRGLSGVLRLDGCPVSAESFGNVADLDYLSHLDLSRCSTFDDRCAATVSRMSRLRHLNLHGTSVTASGVEQLGKLVELEWLALPGLRITNSALQQLKNLKSLEELHVNHTPVTDGALEPIGHFPYLQRLFLKATAITDAGLPHLAKLADLYELHLEETKVTEEGVRKLQEALPDCEIFSDVAPPFTFLPTTVAPASPPPSATPQSKTERPEPTAKSGNQESAGWYGWPTDAPAPAIAPFDEEQARKHQQAWADYLKLPLEFTNTIGMKFILIPPGEFMMGSTPEEIEANLKTAVGDDYWQEHILSEGPRHKVVITRPFYLGICEVMQSAYVAVAGKNPSFFAAKGADPKYVAKVFGVDTGNYPLEGVSWNEAAKFCIRLSELEDLRPRYAVERDTVRVVAGVGYRLPTEAEWEFACRAGTLTNFWAGDSEEDLARTGWFEKNSDARTHLVGELPANPFGLNDMHGNVWEWVEDWWEPRGYDQFSEMVAVDPQGPASTRNLRAVRGGTWLYIAPRSRSALRNSAGPASFYQDLGFRVTLDIDAVRRKLPAARPGAPAASSANPNAAKATPGTVLTATPGASAAAQSTVEAQSPASLPPRPTALFSASTARLVRGGDWIYAASDCRCSVRYPNEPTDLNDRIGFRVALPAVVSGVGR